MAEAFAELLNKVRNNSSSAQDTSNLKKKIE